MEQETEKKPIIMCIGDSLALPGHGNRFEDTWFSKLQIQFPDYLFASHFKRAITSYVLVSEGGGDSNFPGGADCLEFYLPEIVVVQLGIVDCAPRYLKRQKKTTKILEAMPSKIKNLVYRLIKQLKKRSVKNADVSPIHFFHFWEVYLQRCQKNNVKKVIIIKICTPDDTINKKSPDMLQAIEMYNKIIDEIVGKFDFVTSIDPLGSGEKKIYDDGYHPNKYGNELVFQELKKEINLV